jgi:hypothetical protein
MQQLEAIKVSRFDKILIEGYLALFGALVNVCSSVVKNSRCLSRMFSLATSSAVSARTTPPL